MEASSPRRKSRPPPPPETVASLPPEILEQVLSFLPLRDAVRTSAVSRAWRHLWESAPGLALEWLPGTDAAVADAVLARYSGPVRSFEFVLQQGSLWRGDDWVPLLADKRVQILKLCYDSVPPSTHCMDASIFSCRELTSLDLSGGCKIMGAPSGLAGFPKLTRLSLRQVGFQGNGVRILEALIAESPMLEVLWLDDLWFPHDEFQNGLEEWFIKAPKLRDLSIYSHYYDYNWQIEDLPSIEEVGITTLDAIDDTGGRDFVKLLTGLARVRKLNLKIQLNEEVNALEELSWSFGNLTDLSLDTNFCTLPGILCKLCLLNDAPNLETLKFRILLDDPEEVEVGVDLLNELWTGGLLGNLKTFTIDSASCRENEMHFIEFVLSKAPRLQELHIVNVYDCLKSKEELLEEITRYKKASPQVNLFFSYM